jgi:hypothetical protein
MRYYHGCRFHVPGTGSTIYEPSVDQPSALSHVALLVLGFDCLVVSIEVSNCPIVHRACSDKMHGMSPSLVSIQISVAELRGLLFGHG